MMAEAPAPESLSVNTKFGTIAATGWNVVMLIALVGLTASFVWGYREIINEMETKFDWADCQLGLNLYAQRQPKGEAFNWYDLPPSLQRCAPGYLFEKREKK